VKEVSEIAVEILGANGALLGWSKSDYWKEHQGDIIVFNGNVCTKTDKLWWGDLNVTLSRDKLQKLANELGEEVYVLSEQNARFEYEANPRLDRAVLVVQPV
jgi:hypothetical protein